MSFTDLNLHFSRLELPRTATWTQVRAQYRRLVSRYHPDRIVGNPAAREHAEERIKEINSAYAALTEYRAKYGSLTGELNENGGGFTSECIHPRTDSSDSAAPGSGEPPVQGSGPSGRVILARAAFGILALSLFIYLIWPEIDLQPASMPPSAQIPTVESTAAAIERTFTVDSTVADVYEIQGVPNRIEKDTWYYGNSRIHFSRGRVVSWQETPDYPLRVSAVVPRVASALPKFGLGSSKLEVRAIQGSPQREEPDVWHYGASQVYFSEDAVTGWSESPLYPLKTRR